MMPNMPNGAMSRVKSSLHWPVIHYQVTFE